MNRNIAIILLSIALLSCLYFCVYHWITVDTTVAMKSERPELEWLRQEYDLNEKQFSIIRTKHEAHDVVCQKLCNDLVEARKALQKAIDENSELTPEVKQALTAWTAQRGRCHEATISHMYDISSVMDAADATLYRERIFRHVIVPGRMPHVGENGEFHKELIEYADPGSIDSEPSEDGRTK